MTAVDRYDYIINGEALKEIHAYMEHEHTFAEYTTVSTLVITQIWLHSVHHCEYPDYYTDIATLSTPL